MSDSNQEPLRRVLIASANPLFARGLQKMVAQRWQNRRVDIRLADSMEDATRALENWQPDLVIVDYDDRDIQRGAFLSHFITGDRPMQVMLVSLRASGEVVVYDRRTLTPAQAEDWLDLPWIPAEPASVSPVEAGPVEAVSSPRSALRSGGMKHYVVVGILTVILTLLTGFGLLAVGLMPVQAADEALTVDSMIYLQLWMIAFLFALIVSFIIYSVYLSRNRNRAEFGTYFKGSTGLEVAWTLVPLITVIVLAFFGARDLASVRQPDSNALEVKVTGFQWGWLFEYPESGIQSDTLYLPVDRQVHFSLTSRDVIHSFWVPEFRLKQDLLPGENLVKELRITPNRVGDYKVRCAEMCGGAHAYMESPVKVISQQDFDAWVNEQSNMDSMTPDQRGQILSKNQGCLSCHTTDGTRLVGPSWKGLYGAEVQLADGSTVTVDDAYIVTAIKEPNAQVHQGFPPNVMQSYANTLTDEQIADIIAFVKTLK